MTLIKRVAVFLTVLSILLLTSGCKGKYKDAYIYFELSQKPLTLDAQTASSESELLIIRNIYEGLLRKDESGKTVCGAAIDYSIDGSTYTFNLKKDAVWSTGDAVTANDFVFAFQRAVSNKTQAPFVSRLFCIKGAKDIYEGRADMSALGVEAPDDFTLKITLNGADDNFEETLTTSVCMPCCQSFFEQCKGKYGLKKEYIISNGSYSLTKWNKDDFGIRIYRRDDYTGSFTAQNKAVFFSCHDDKSAVELIDVHSVDAAMIKSNEISQAEEKGINITSNPNICWVMTLGTEFSPDIRKALALSFSSDIYKDKLNKGFSPALSLFPSVLKYDEDVNSAGITPYNLELAKSILLSAVSKTQEKKFPPATLYYYDCPSVKPIVTAIAGHWQQYLSAFINIKASSSLEELQNELDERTLQFAVFPITATDSSVSEYLQNFNVAYNGQSLAQIQSSLLSQNTLLPIAFESTNIGHSSDLQNLRIENSNGYIDFSSVKKFET